MSDSEATGNIVYALVGIGDKPLAGYSEFKGPFVKLCQNYLHNVEPNSSGGYKIEDYFIYYLSDDRISFLILTDKTYPRYTAIACLESIKKEFDSSIENKDLHSMGMFGLDEEFKPKLKMKYEYFNENKEVLSEATYKLKEEIFRMKDEVLNASDLLNERGDRLKVANEKAENLKDTSQRYKKAATKVRKTTSKKKCFIITGVIVSILVILYACSVIVCGSFTF